MLRPLFRGWYEIHFAVLVLFRRMVVYFYMEPLFRSRCASAGRNLQLYSDLPYIDGHVDIHIGDDVTITGSLYIASGRIHERPELNIQNRVTIGGGSVISVNQSVVIEDDVMIASNCRISDNDGHPRGALLRASHAPLNLRDIRPVLIRRYAWIGNGAQIMKGVIVGEGAIIGANSVVISNIPDYCVAMGNPAEVLFRNVGRAKTTEQTTKAEAANEPS